MLRRCENIYKRQDGRWEGRYIKGRENGKAKYGYVFARSYIDVKQKLIYAKSVVLSTIAAVEKVKSLELILTFKRYRRHGTKPKNFSGSNQVLLNLEIS